MIRETIRFAMSTSGWLSVVSRASLAALLAVASTAEPTGQTGLRRIETLRSVTVAPTKSGATVVIEGNGPLGQPSSGLANDPPRIYIDLVDVLPGPPIQPPPENPLVRRVRVAEHSANPLVTRVVIDLTMKATYRIDSSASQQGRVTVSVEASRDQITASEQPAARQTPPAPKPAGPPTPESATAERAYDFRIAAALVRLHALRPLLESIDRQANPVPDNMDAGASEFEAIGKILGGIKAPRSRERTHALLQRTCTMGVRAIRVRQDGARTNDPGASLNASSAAAGALLMLDRANRELAEAK